MQGAHGVDGRAKRRATVLRAVLALELKGEPINTAIGEAADALGLAKSHTWALYRRFRESDARASALELRRRGPKRGSRRLGSAVEAVIDESLKRHFLVRERPSLSRIWREIRSECVAKGLQPPTRRTVQARLDAMDRRDVVRKRHGSEAASGEFAARPGRFRVDAPLAVVQIDHTQADIMLVDHIDREPIARPFLTVAIDVATRVVLGAHVSFDAPSVLSVALCLDHCVQRKTIHVPETLEQLIWPTAGVPATIHVDNGAEFHSEAFKAACDDWGIALSYRPPGGKHYGGHVERLIGTAMGAVHVLPGTTYASTAERGEYDSQKQAALTLVEFEEWLHLEICRYHNTRHAALGRTPLQAWADLGGDAAGRQVVDVDAFRISFLPAEWRRLGRTGVTLFGVRYWSDAFGSLVGRHDGKVLVKYDPRDLSQVWVYTNDDRMIAARYRDLSRPRISLWESRRARKDWRDRNCGRLDEKALFDVVSAQRRLAETARQRTKAAKLDAVRSATTSSKNARRDPSRDMFAIDTGNPDLPTYPIDDLDDFEREN